MARHPATEGNDLKPKRVDAQAEITVPAKNSDGRVGLSDFEADVQDQIENTAQSFSEGLFPELFG